MTTNQGIDRWLGEKVDFGGEMLSRAEVYAWFQKEGYPDRAAALWFMGYENTQRLTRRKSVAS